MKSIKVMMMLVIALLSVASVQAQDNNEDVIFYESFDGMNGKGGNDGNWNMIADSNGLNWNVNGADNEGWDIFYTTLGIYHSSAVQPANQCILLGTSASLKTPTLNKLTSNEATLTFKAASSTYVGKWPAKYKQAELYLEIENGGSLDVTTIKLDYSNFSKTYTAKITNATPESKIRFFTNINMALFLDEVKIVKEKTPETPDVPSTPTAISTVKKNTAVSDNKVYNLNGQLVGTSTQNLKQGVYIINNKKVVVK